MHRLQILFFRITNKVEGCSDASDTQTKDEGKEKTAGMDNCDLEKLAVSRGQLQPEFTPEVTDYKVTVESSVEKVSLDLATSDSGASCTIVSNTVLVTLTLLFLFTLTLPTTIHNCTILSENCFSSWGGTAPRTSSWRWE